MCVFIWFTVITWAGQSSQNYDQPKPFTVSKTFAFIFITMNEVETFLKDNYHSKQLFKSYFHVL